MRSWLGLALFALLAASGCRDIECASGLAPGVEIRILEAGVGPHTDPIMVRYRIDGGAWTEIDDTMSGCAERTFCQIGWEMDGSYEIQIIRGSATVTVFTDVSADRCHVLTRMLAVEIPDT